MNRHPIRSSLLHAVAGVLSALARLLTWKASQQLGRRIGAFAWRISRRDRRRSLEHLAIAFPELPESERRRIGRESFLHLGAMLGEALYLSSRGPEELAEHVRLEGFEHAERARASGRPIVVVTGHCGNWELLAAALNARGLGMAVVARELDDAGLQELLLGFRERFGTRTIVRGSRGAARELLRVLKGPGALGILIDQDTRVDGVFVPFFGRPAYTPTAAADLATRFDAIALPVFIERLADGSHLARVAPPLAVSPDAVEATAAMTRVIETQIRRLPEQWVWLHRRWRRRPPGDQLVVDDQRDVSSVSNPSEKMAQESGVPSRRK